MSTHSTVEISGKTVTVPLAWSIIRNDDTNLRISYTKPATGSNNKLTDRNGNELSSFADYLVTNTTPKLVAFTATTFTPPPSATSATARRRCAPR